MLPFNRNSSDPKLKDLLDLYKKDVMQSLNCHAIANIQSFDSVKQTVTAKISYSKTYYEKATDGSYSERRVAYPLLLDCPAVIMSGGNGSLTFPIAKGDTCLILFNDRDLDNWFAGATTDAGVASPRLHSFSDGIALVGIRSKSNALSSYDSSRVVLQNTTTGVGVSPSKVKIYNQTTTLNTLLGQLINAITLITTTNCVVGSPVAISPASIAALNNIATGLGGLLE